LVMPQPRKKGKQTNSMLVYMLRHSHSSSLFF
jgi:uncharacterized protein (TIGR00369 family)